MDGAPPPMLWDEARDLTNLIKSVLTKVWDELIIEAYHRRAWAALGHQSWDVYCEQEFAGCRLRLPREERIKAVYSLRENGLSTRVSAGTVRNDLDSGGQNCPPDNTSGPHNLGGTITGLERGAHRTNAGKKLVPRRLARVTFASVIGREARS
jgi:hypothetical protein